MLALLAAFDFRPFAVPAMVAAAAALLILTQIRKRRQSGGAESGPAVPSGVESDRAMPAEGRQWQVELHDLTRSTRAELDTRLAALQRLLIEADRRIARLESLERSAQERPATPRPHFDPPPADRDATAGRRTAAIYAMADAGLNAAAIANRLREKLSEVESTLGLRRG